MTLEELYREMGGDYQQALRVLRMDKLIDKHIRKFTHNGVIDALLAAGRSMDPTALFETAHAVKGVCANLGLTSLADVASEITEEYRPGHPRSLTDAQVKELLGRVETLYQAAADGIRRYEEA